MMNVVIIEDEKPAAEKLKNALQRADPAINVLTVLHTVGSSIAWLRENPSPALLFMDIELTDGSSFRIFDAVTISCPVIFTTAFDDYWQKAFEQNGIDYLLKPIRQGSLETALQKYRSLEKHFTSSAEQPGFATHGRPDDRYKKRMLVKRGLDFLAIKTDEIAYMYASHKFVCLVNQEGQKFVLDKSLSDLEKELDPAQFYRVNRKYLTHINAIRRIRSFSKGKLLIEVEPAVKEEICISQENAAAFKEWLGR